MQQEENTPNATLSQAKDEFQARNALLGYVMKLSNGRADLAQLNALMTALTAPANVRIGALEAEIAASVAGAARPLSKVDTFLAEHLRLWKDEGVPAPVNELQSIHAWLGCLARNGKDDTVARMRARMLLLTKAANALHAEGPEAEDAAGIYDRRPRESNDKEA